ncbi:MAG: YraN family protein [Patescibacteria group bacterium]|jgi:putative endonuclease
MNYRQIVGKFGENIAKNYLLRRNYQIISVNEKIGFKEVDIIAKKGDFLIFVEVKTRLSSVFGGAEDAFNFSKFHRLKEAIDDYIYKNDLDGNFIRLDFISVDIDKYKKIANIKHYKDII